MRIVEKCTCYHCGEKYYGGYEFESYMPFGNSGGNLVLSKVCFGKLVKDNTVDPRRWSTTDHAKVLLWCDAHGGTLMWESDTFPSQCLYGTHCKKYRGIYRL